MACHECIEHTNIEPCCGPDHSYVRNFGAPSEGEWRPVGYDLVNPTKPPWIQTGILAAFTYYSYNAWKGSPEPDISKVGAVGSVLGPAGVALLWHRYRQSV